MDHFLKCLAVAVWAAVMNYFKELIPPFLVLVLAMIFDYMTGMMSASYRHKKDSRIGIIGILKKIGYVAIVAVGVILDYLISFFGGEIGVPMGNQHYVGLILIAWLIVNECISILENCDEMKLPVPKFVGQMLKRLKRHTEELAGEESDDGEG